MNMFKPVGIEYLNLKTLEKVIRLAAKHPGM